MCLEPTWVGNCKLDSNNKSRYFSEPLELVDMFTLHPFSWFFTLHWPSGRIQSLSCNICLLCVCVCVCEIFNTSYYSYLAKLKVKLINYKQIPQGKLCKNISLIFSNFDTDMVKNHRTEKKIIFSLHHSLMDLGQDQQSHPTVHTAQWESQQREGLWLWLLVLVTCDR